MSSGGAGRLFAHPWRAIVWYACALHYAWGCLLAGSEPATRSTPVAAIVTVSGGRWGALAVLFAVAAMAQAADLAHRWWGLLVPQQFIMIISAGGAVHAAWVGHYADGVPRPWPFILGDQLPVILSALLYTYALLAHREAND